MFCTSCISSDPTSDTVRVNFSPIKEQDEVAAAEQAEARRRAEEEAKLALAQEERAHEVQRVLEQKEEERRVAQRNKDEEERLRAQRQREDEERLRFQRQKQEEEDERIKRQLEEKQKREEKDAIARRAVEEWLQKNKFSGINTKRSSLFSSKFPLHAAAKENNVEIAALLVKFGADIGAKNSSGQTPSALAGKLNKKGSHDALLKVVRAPTPRIGGA